jgi:mannose-6-phosphate isomerase-like protein (cupin superfamily)
VRTIEVTNAYLLAEHTVAVGGSTPFRCHARDHRTFVVIAGRVALETAAGARPYGPLAGWHALPGSVYRITNAGDDPAVLVEAGSIAGETVEGIAPRPATGDCPDVSDYTVRKPWGSEVWYTHNLPGLPYALKRIRMTAGHQSSLQSHRHKLETNYVIDGEATVLTGADAPDDLTATIDLASLTTTVHRPRSGWTNPPGELHRVIARSDYTSIEISTPELDDVIRWQDDTGRGHGTIASEHAGGRS